MLRRILLLLAALVLIPTGVRAAPESVLGAIEAEIQGIVNRTAPAVVRVEALKKGVLTMDRRGVRGAAMPTFHETSVGAGFVAGADRYILASHSVVDGAVKIRVTFGGGLTTVAEIVDTNAFFRVAVLRAQEMPDDLKPLDLSERKPRPGSFAILCGRAHDSGPSAMLGLVCDTGRAHLGYDRFFIVSATLTPGESGAPFMGSDGRVLGLGSASLTDRKVIVRLGSSTGGILRSQSATSQSRLACCVPASDLRRILADVTRHGRIQQAWLGVTLRYEEPVIAGVVADSPAEGAALEPGDRILAIAGDAVENRMQLVGRLARLRPGTVVSLRIHRDGADREVHVALLQRPKAHERDLLREKAGIRVMRAPDSCRAPILVEDLIVAVNGEPATDSKAVLLALAGFGGEVPVEIILIRDGLRMKLASE